jgi:hypothetical protein
VPSLRPGKPRSCPDTLVHNYAQKTATGKIANRRLVLPLYHLDDLSNNKTNTQQNERIEHRTKEQSKHFAPTLKGSPLNLGAQQSQPSICQNPSKNNNRNNHFVYLFSLSYIHIITQNNPFVNPFLQIVMNIL